MGFTFYVATLLRCSWSGNLEQAENYLGGCMPRQALSAIPDDRAVEHIRRYFGKLLNGRPRYTGSRFETFSGGGDRNEPNRVTAADLIAVSMLSVHVPAQAAIGILEDLNDEIESLLAQVPVEARIEDLRDTDFEAFFERDAPASALWRLLRQKEDTWGIGQTTASKILARKRPHLIPIYDSVISAQARIPNSDGQWELWFEAFQGDSGGLFANRLQTIREMSGQEHLSLLRVLDITLWMEGKSNKLVHASAGKG